MEDLKMMELLNKLAFDMDGAVTSIEAKLEGIQDVNVLFGHLRDEMDGAVYRGEERYYFQEVHRQVRVLSELLYYLVMDLTESHAKNRALQSSFFSLVKGEQSR